MSYFLRATYAQIYFNIINEYIYPAKISDILVGAVFDLLPLTLLMVIHHMNFKTIRQDETSRNTMDIQLAEATDPWGSQLSRASTIISVDFIRNSGILEQEDPIQDKLDA